MLAPFLYSHGTAAAAEAADPFAHPPELEQDVRFWIRVYTEVTTDQGLLHDDWNLGLVYEVLRFDPEASPAERERVVAEAKARYRALLHRFAAGATDGLTAHERRILHAFGENPRPAQFLDAVDRIRFQLGQADRFREGLIRAAAWEKVIERTLEQHGVPKEIAALPHVESSFNPAAYSKVGAAGLWLPLPGRPRHWPVVHVRDAPVSRKIGEGSAHQSRHHRRGLARQRAVFDCRDVAAGENQAVRLAGGVPIHRIRHLPHLRGGRTRRHHPPERTEVATACRQRLQGRLAQGQGGNQHHQACAARIPRFGRERYQRQKRQEKKQQ